MNIRSTLTVVALLSLPLSFTLFSAEYTDQYTLVGDKNYLSGYPAINPDQTINAVIEIPTGTNAKWEVTKPDGVIKWKFKKGKPRVVKYLAYPANYGMIPQTLLSKENGGDGDPLDVIVLGRSIERGTVVKAKLIGVLKLLDGGEQDDKLIAIADDNSFPNVTNLEDLEEQYHGILKILETWFTNYKGPGEMESKGYSDMSSALIILEKAIEDYKEQR